MAAYLFIFASSSSHSHTQHIHNMCERAPGADLIFYFLFFNAGRQVARKNDGKIEKGRPEWIFKKGRSSLSRSLEINVFVWLRCQQLIFFFF